MSQHQHSVVRCHLATQGRIGQSRMQFDSESRAQRATSLLIEAGITASPRLLSLARGPSALARLALLSPRGHFVSASLPSILDDVLGPCHALLA